MMMAITYGFFHFDTVARQDEREIVTVEKEVEKEKIVTKIVKEYETVVVEKDSVIQQKQKEINYVAKQRDEALAEVERIKRQSDDALGRLRDALDSAQSGAKGDAERSKQLIAAQGRLLTECGNEVIELGKELERIAAENREFRQRFKMITGK